MNYKIKVTISGRTYQLSTDVDDGYIQQIAAYVDKEISDVTNTLHASTVDAATMAAMNIADNYFHARTEAESLRQRVETLEAEHQARSQHQESVEELRRQLAQALGEKNALQQQMTESSGLRAQLKEALDECGRLRKEIVRMGKNG